ncbi:MAG: adenylate/guanylate cyclase domain-containing protein, partial [Leptospiraceae bacterium]|nr:adenylate/guanylate cyclase domain-containing protein [Leptospiraceae bacterium]
VVANIYPVLTVVLVCANIGIALKHSFRPARYFALAWSFLLASVIYFVLGNMGLVPGTFLSQYGSVFGASLEAILLSLALGYRINDLRSREESARKQILEEKSRALDLQKSYTESFRRFVPDQFLHYLRKESILEIERGDSIQSEMTVLFSDLRNFTAFSESAGEELVFHFLNLYLEQMEPIVQSNGGFIDKFIGDAIMALFPDPVSATKASSEMIATLQNMQNDKEPRMESGCGLHHGPLMLGTVGSQARLETTVIGDTVNMASRLESLNKTLGTRILLSRAVFESLQESPLKELCRQIGIWSIRGKTGQQDLFELFANDAEPLRQFKQQEAGALKAVLEEMKSPGANLDSLADQLRKMARQVPEGHTDKPLLSLIKQLEAKRWE